MSIQDVLPNWTLIPQMLIWFTVLFVLSRFIFKPYGKVIEQRIKETEGLQSEAEKLRGEAQQMHARYQERIDSLRAELHRMLEEHKRQATMRANEIIAVARRNANEEAERALQEMEQEGERAKEQLASELERFSQSICEKVLGRKVTP